jgi:hypothetical protein
LRIGPQREMVTKRHSARPIGVGADAVWDRNRLGGLGGVTSATGALAVHR